MQGLRAWLIYDRAGAGRNRDYILAHREVGREFGISFELKLREQWRPPYREQLSRELEEERPDFAIVRTIAPALSRELEQKGIPIFNNAMVAEICNHKGKTISYVSANSPVPVIPTETFPSEALTAEFLKGRSGQVIKAVDGHGGAQVFSVEDSFSDIKKGIGSSDFVLQPMVRGAADVRVYVIGREIVGAVLRRPREGFKANYSLGGEAESYTLPGQAVKWVNQICCLFSFGLAGIDFLIDERGRFFLNEIEDVVGARMLYACQPDVQLLERYFAFIRDNILQSL